MAKPGRTGLIRILHAAGYSWLGLKAAWRHEAAFRQELVVALVLTPCAFWLGQNLLEIAVLLLCLGLVVVVELLNSALEAVVDRIGAERHELSGRAKDMGSAAVLVSVLIAVAVWGAMIVRAASA